MRISLCLIALFSLTACETFSNPGFLPTGYKHHRGPSHSVPGPDVDDIGYDYNAQKNSDVVQVWRVVLDDLIDRLEQQTDLSPRSIYLESLAQSDAFTQTFDHVLRQKFTQRGYMVSLDPVTTPHIRYDAYLVLDSTRAAIVNEATIRRYIPDTELKTYVLTLALDTAEAEEGFVGGFYKLPYYGFDDDPGGQSASLVLDMKE